MLVLPLLGGWWCGDAKHYIDFRKDLLLLSFCFYGGGFASFDVHILILDSDTSASRGGYLITLT